MYRAIQSANVAFPGTARAPAVVPNAGRNVRAGKTFLLRSGMSIPKHPSDFLVGLSVNRSRSEPYRGLGTGCRHAICPRGNGGSSDGVVGGGSENPDWWGWWKTRRVPRPWTIVGESRC